MRLVKIPSYIKKLFPNLIWNKKTTEKYIYLTFDDGPTPEVTSWVLKQLQAYNAKATFFCLGKNVEKYPKLYKQLLDEGHKVGNHTYSHLNAWKTNSAEYLADVERCSKVLDSKLFRPPYGKFTPKLNRILAQSFDIVLWDVITYDFDKSFGAKKCLKKAIKHSKKGSIIVFHDSDKAFKNLSYCLPKYLAYFTAKGYEFKTL